MAALPPEFNAPNTVSRMSTAASVTNNDYRCLVSIFFFGATDAHNMLRPYGSSNPNTAIYESVRPVGVRIQQSEVSGQTLGTSPNWAFHPSLPSFYNKWQAGELAVVREVGILNRPTTKQQYLSNPDGLYVPLDLFAHNVQVNAWQAAVPFRAPRETGWFGRLGNLTDDYFNPSTRVGSGSISVSGVVQQLYAYSPKITPSYPPTSYPVGNLYGVGSSIYLETRDNLAQTVEYNSPFLSPIAIKQNLISQAFVTVLRNGIRTQEALLADAPGWDISTSEGSEIEAVFIAAANALATTTVTVPDPVNPSTPQTLDLPSPEFLNTMKNCAKLIYSRDTLGQRRQAIYGGLGGFDNHNYLRENHDPRLKTVDICFQAFWDALDVMETYTPGVKDGVVLFTESDFSRTLRSNGTFGTDHAWSGPHFVMGKPVIGGLYGGIPDYTLGGPWDVYENAGTSLGRYIPQISIEQYYATLLEWASIPSQLVNLVIPASPLFSPQSLNFLPKSA